MQSTSLLAGRKVCSLRDFCHGGAGEYSKRTVNYWGDNVWRLYQSWAPDAQTSVARVSLSGVNRKEVCAKANKWLVSMKNVDPEPLKIGGLEPA
jgi:hypothetical protein